MGIMGHYHFSSLELPLYACWKIWPMIAKAVFLITMGCSNGSLTQDKSEQAVRSSPAPLQIIHGSA